MQMEINWSFLYNHQKQKYISGHNFHSLFTITNLNYDNHGCSYDTNIFTWYSLDSPASTGNLVFFQTR